jgi:SAM-dependent methyltransferase
MECRDPSRPLAAARLSDGDFDRVLPESIRRQARQCWTPVAVVERAAAFLAPDPLCRVLDVGAGVGKFCIIGAAATGAVFSGIEHRSQLVAIAKSSARALSVPGIDFACGTIETVNWKAYDSFYFFNPFEENVYREHSGLDRTVALSEERFWRDVAFTERVLARAAQGTRVATYYGFGGRIPSSYQLVAERWYRGGALRFWTKISADDGDETIEGGTIEALMPFPEKARNEDGA